MYSLVTSISISQASFRIRDRGDFRMVLDCFNALNDEELTKAERLYSSLIIFYEDINGLDDINKNADKIEELYSKMVWFFNGGKDETEGLVSKKKLIDWEADSNLICSAVNKVAGREIRSEKYLHWWTFLGYYMAVGESALSTVIGIRNKMANGEQLQDYEKKFRANNPQYFNIDMRTAEEKEADNYFRELWGGE